MIYRQSFDEKGELTWREEWPKPPDLSHLQGAMFLDRPDLWPVRKPKSRRNARPLNNQTAFAFLTDLMNECKSSKCQKKGGDTREA